MKNFIKTIFIVLIMYIFDILIFGSIIGLIFMFGEYLSYIMYDTPLVLWKEYVRGIVMYWIVDSFVSKFRETYREYEEHIKETK